MKFSAPKIKLLLGAFLLHSAIVNAATRCNADDCLRALFPTATPIAVSSALAFCSTYTTSKQTRTTGFPTRATAACGISPSRYSSACSCKPTPTTPACPPVVAPNNLIKNGGFECGLSPWTAGDVVNTVHKLSSPGEASGTAYEFEQVGPGSPDADRNPAFVTQDVSGLIPGADYILSYSAFFDACVGVGTGLLGTMINRAPVYTYSGCDFGRAAAGKFAPVKIPFTATVATENVRLDFLADRPGTVIKIDNVAVTPA